MLGRWNPGALEPLNRPFCAWPVPGNLLSCRERGRRERPCGAVVSSGPWGRTPQPHDKYGTIPVPNNHAPIWPNLRSISYFCEMQSQLGCRRRFAYFAGFDLLRLASTCFNLLHAGMLSLPASSVHTYWYRLPTSMHTTLHMLDAFCILSTDTHPLHPYGGSSQKVLIGTYSI